MGKASTSKKIQRLQRAGATGRPGVQRNLGFPIAIVAIIVVGSLLVVWGRSQRSADAEEAPTLEDHWHVAFGIYVCDAYLPAIDEFEAPNGIHTHGDGLIHIHPFNSGGMGENANLGTYAANAGIVLEDDRMVLADGTEKKNGQTCGSGEERRGAKVQVYVWPPQADDETEPAIFTRDLLDTRFVEDGSGVAIVFAPPGADVPRPSSMDQIEELGASDSGAAPPTDTTPSVPTETTPATDPTTGESTDTTAAGETTDTTVATGDTTATTAAETTETTAEETSGDGG